MVKSALLAGAACLLALPSALRAQGPVGSEFQVNVYTTGSQGSASVATDAHENFVVVWADAAGIVGRRFTASGAPRGGEFLVRSYTAGYPSLPSVASSANGSFVVVWHSYGPDGSASGVFGHRFDAFGAPAGGEFAVNTYTTGNQSQPVVSSDASGNFVVVWQSAGQDANGYGVFSRRFDASGGGPGRRVPRPLLHPGLPGQPVRAGRGLRRERELRRGLGQPRLLLPAGLEYHRRPALRLRRDSARSRIPGG